MNFLKKHIKNLTNKFYSQDTTQFPKAGLWEDILSSHKYKHQRMKGKSEKILCATSVGSHEVVTRIDSLVAMGLWLRGAEPEFLLCDEVLPACEAAMFQDLPSMDDFLAQGSKAHFCANCFSKGQAFYDPLPIPVKRYSDFVSVDEIAHARQLTGKLETGECFRYETDGMPLGEQARAGVLRFFGKADLSSEDPEILKRVARQYLMGALVTAKVTENAIDQLRPECIVAHHGVYVPQGVLGVVARKKGIRVVNWGPSYRNTTAIYSHGDTYHHTFMSEPIINWEDRLLSPEENKKLDEYLYLRRAGKGDWSWVTPERGSVVEDKSQQLAASIGLDISKPVYGLLTNVLWDAQLYYANSGFTDMLEWLFMTLDYFIQHPGLQLVVRIHPHEVKHGNRQPVAVEIQRRYHHLPDNVKIINHDAPYSTYALMELCRAVLIYGTKTGVELAPLGQPVITAGEAWIRNKGITYDAKSREEYLDLLEELPKIQPLAPEVVERARRYAYHYFFRRMITLSSLDPAGGYPPALQIKSVGDLLPGHDRGLDIICEGILTGKEFIYEPVL